MKKHAIVYIFVIICIVIWQILYSLEIWPKIMFPSVIDIFKSFIDAFVKDNIFSMVGYSIKLIIKGLFIGIILAMVFSCLSIVFNPVYQIYNWIVSVFDLIPGVALIPLAILWLGIGESSVVLIVVHSVIWPMSRNVIDGFKAVPKLYIEVGQNLGFSKLQQIFSIYVPSAFPYILSGLRVGWARAWRGLISTEMIFGTTSAGAGIGWFIMMKRSNVDISGVFAAIIIIVIIGCIVEKLLFSTIEKLTVSKWGMSR